MMSHIACPIWIYVVVAPLPGRFQAEDRIGRWLAKWGLKV